MRELPHLVQLHRDHGQDVACLSLNLDYAGDAAEPPEMAREQVLKVLTKCEASFQNVLCSDSDETMYQKLDLGSVPAVLVYGRDGTLQKRFDNDKGEYGSQGFNYEKHVVPYVKGLLQADDPS